MAAIFEVFRDNMGRYQFRLVASNREVIVATPFGYSSRDDALYGIEAVKRFAPSAPIEHLDHKDPDG